MNYGKLTAGTTKTAIDTAKLSEKGEIITYLSRMGDVLDHYLADDCRALGFQMDCGNAFSEKYGKAASSCDELNRIIDEVTDIELLGSAIPGGDILTIGHMMPQTS